MASGMATSTTFVANGNIGRTVYGDCYDCGSVDQPASFSLTNRLVTAAATYICVLPERTGDETGRIFYALAGAVQIDGADGKRSSPACKITMTPVFGFRVTRARRRRHQPREHSA